MVDEESMDLEFKIAIKLWMIIPPIMILIGTFGNILTIVVLLKRKNRYSPTALFLTSMAVSDLTALWTGLLRQWVLYTFDYDVRNSFSATCKIHLFIVNLSLQSSSWFLIALTVERCLSVFMPHRVRHLCRFLVASISCLTVVAFIVIVNLHWFWTFELTEKRLCCGNALFSSELWFAVDLCVFNIIPAIVLIFGNACIIVRVFLRMRTTLTRINPAPTTEELDLRTAPVASGIQPIISTGRRRTFSQMTLILIILSVLFLVCTMPIGVLAIAFNGYIADIWWAISNLLMYLNNTLNFLLYFLSGSRFKDDARVLLCGLRVQPRHA